MKREEMQSLFESWKKMTPEEQTNFAAAANMQVQDATAAAFGIAFQRAKKDFQQAGDAARRNARATAPTKSVTAPNPLA